MFSLPPFLRWNYDKNKYNTYFRETGLTALFSLFGTMNSGKSIEILKVAYNYEEQGKPVVLLTSRLDNRDGVGYISSRIGMKRKAYPIGDGTDIFGYIANMDPRPYCVFL